MFRKNANTSEHAAVKKTLAMQLIIPSLLMLTSLAVLAAATMAWFASNRETDSSGMQIQVDSSNPNLVIVDATDKTEDAANAEVRALTAADAQFAVTLTASGTTLAPATHDWAVGTATGLKYLRNPGAIDRVTGLQKAGAAALAYGAVPVYVNTDTRQYYFDYTVKLASTEIAMNYTALKATLSSPDLSATAANEYQHAASVDFYLGSVASGNFLATANLKSPPHEVTLLNTSGTIPLNTTAAPADCCITIVMRFYFDGALEKTAGQAYVHSDNLTTANFNMAVSFEAVEPTT